MSKDSEKPWTEDYEEKRPPIEYLAGFVDDELSASDREMVQAWLDRHPEDAALVQAHRNLLRLWRETAPAAPSEKVWHEVLEQIVDQGSRIGVGTSQNPDTGAGVSGSSQRGRGRWMGAASLAAAAAAVVVLALFVPHKEQRPLLPKDDL